MTDASLTRPGKTSSILRSLLVHAVQRGWAPLAEMPLPDGRRADVLAMLPEGGFAIIEVKSCAADFAADQKWPSYRAYCDQLFFAVGADFPEGLLPADVGLFVAEDLDVALQRDAPLHPLAPARRRALLHRFARLAALRATGIADPFGMAELRMALRSE